MSLRRKLALWLCPELAVQEHKLLWRASRAVMQNASAARQSVEDAAWRAEVLGHLSTISATLGAVTEGGNAMRTIHIDK